MANSDITPATKVTPPEWGAPEWAAMNEEEFAENLVAKVEGEEAILTCDEMDIIEKFWEADRRTRRCALIMLTKPFSWLRKKVESDTEFAQSVIELHQCSDVSKYEYIAGLLFQAERRLMCALACREDMSELMDRVKAEQEATA